MTNYYTAWERVASIFFHRPKSEAKRPKALQGFKQCTCNRVCGTRIFMARNKTKTTASNRKDVTKCLT
jgi:hypothetical protein